VIFNHCAGGGGLPPEPVDDFLSQRRWSRVICSNQHLNLAILCFYGTGG
jgi:hypothetical protein